MSKNVDLKVGQHVHLIVRDNLFATVIIMKKKQPYGRELFLVVPASGIGEAWVERSSLGTLPYPKTSKKKNAA